MSHPRQDTTWSELEHRWWCCASHLCNQGTCFPSPDWLPCQIEWRHETPLAMHRCLDHSEPIRCEKVHGTRAGELRHVHTHTQTHRHAHKHTGTKHMHWHAYTHTHTHTNRDTHTNTHTCVSNGLQSFVWDHVDVLLCQHIIILLCFPIATPFRNVPGWHDPALSETVWHLFFCLWPSRITRQTRHSQDANRQAHLFNGPRHTCRDHLL